MSREIKFRAWDKQRDQMIYDGDYWEGDNRQYGNSSISYPVSVTNKGIVWCKKLGHPNEKDDLVINENGDTGYKNWEVDCTTSKDIELLERTGQKDKKGVEIYEGDIVKVGRKMLGHNHPEDYRSETMRWSDWRGCWTFDDAQREEDKSVIWEAAIYGDREVIGNIYENPELLEPENPNAKGENDNE